MKWIGQHIWDFISRFRNDVYLEDLTESAQDHVVGVDANGKLYKQDVSVGDITGVTAGNALTGGGTSGAVTINHEDTSSQASVDNSGSTYIQDVTLDTYGHVTGLTSAAVPTLNQDTTGQAGTVATIAGLAPNTATTQATQPNITTMTGFVTGNANQLLTDDGDGTVTSEAGLTYSSKTLDVGDDDDGVSVVRRRAHGDGNGGVLKVMAGSATNGGATDAFGGELGLYAGQGTGGAYGGDIAFYSSQRAGSSSTINNHQKLADIDLLTTSSRFTIYEKGGISSDDFFRISVAEHGETSLLTVDASATAADMTISPDGTLHLEAATNKINKIYDFNSTTFENTYSDDQGSGTILKYSPGADESPAGSELFYLHTDGTWNQARAVDVALGASQLLGVGLGASARATGVLIKGFIRVASTEILNVPGSGAVDGLPVYVSTTSGHFDFTAPSSSNEFVRIVGYAIDDNSGDVLIYFNPDKSWVEIA